MMILTPVLHELYTGHFIITWSYGTPLKFLYLLSLRLWCKVLQQYVFLFFHVIRQVRWNRRWNFNFGYPLNVIRLVASNPFSQNLCKIYVWCSCLSALVTSKSRDLFSNYGSSLSHHRLFRTSSINSSWFTNIWHLFLIALCPKNIYLELGNSRKIFRLNLSFHCFTSGKAELLPSLSCLLIENLVLFCNIYGNNSPFLNYFI